MSPRRAPACAALVCLIGALPVHAQSIRHYVITFTPTMSGEPAMTGSFDYNSATARIAHFLVDWNGEPFDLTETANQGPSGATDFPCANNGQATPGGEQTLLFLTNCGSPIQATFENLSLGGHAYAIGIEFYYRAPGCESSDMVLFYEPLLYQFELHPESFALEYIATTVESSGS